MMIVSNFDAYPTIVVTFQESEWNKEIVENCLAALDQKMNLAMMNGHKFELILKGNTDMKSFYPPFYVAPMVIKFLLEHRKMFKNNCVCTAVYSANNTVETLIDAVLSVYTPQSPLKRFSVYETACDWVLEQRIAGQTC